MRSGLFRWSSWEFFMNFWKDNSKGLFFLEYRCEIETTELTDWINKKIYVYLLFCGSSLGQRRKSVKAVSK